MTGWDKDEADARAVKFQEDMQAMIADSTPEELVAIRKMFAFWKGAYMTSGHKRLAQVFIRKLDGLSS